MQGMQKKILTRRTVVDDLIKQLELYRLENRITQVELANDIGVNFSTISRWLNGKTKPNKIQQYHVEKYLSKRKLNFTSKQSKGVK
ncbi:MAG: helix-turn-helix domain-containing protein [Candidatus Omnitrophica bacterium]|nr:helix-turn-helix domain-containing protein [Candidatus Omnitrophota bacterium]